jgi:hypothetical protein
MKLSEIGGYAGLVALVLAIFDRLVLGRPRCDLRRSKTGNKGSRDLSCINLSKYEVVVWRVRTYPKWVQVWSDDSERAAAKGVHFYAIVEPQALRNFPLVLSKGELLNSDNSAWAPFIVWVSWRKMRSTWLPQFPVIIISSAKALRRIAEAK